MMEMLHAKGGGGSGGSGGGGGGGWGLREEGCRGHLLAPK